MMDLPNIPIPKYKYITRADEARKALSVINNYPEFEVDTEGTSLDPYMCESTLMQIGTGDDVFVFDLRHKLPDVDIHGSMFEPLLTDKSKIKILQNAEYDMSVLKVQYGFYIENIYDTMLAERLLNLGRPFIRANLGALVPRYLGLTIPKEAQKTFASYHQKFTTEQLNYAATDVCALTTIKDQQLFEIKKWGLERALALEMDFITPMAEMSLNGIMMDAEKWRIIISEASVEEQQLFFKIAKELQVVNRQTSLFDVPIINIRSNEQLLYCLNRLGIDIKSTGKEVLKEYTSYPIIQDILDWRQLNKLVSTYGESLLAKIHKKTGRLHTEFTQMVDTGRLSSHDPNLQNIPHKQKYRACFVAAPGKVLITADMSSAELRILGNFSMDPTFLEAYAAGIDVHTANASRIFNVPYEKVTPEQRNASKAISFGLVYGLSAHGLSARLRIPKQKAEQLIASYFNTNKGVYNWLENAKRSAVRNGYSETVIGRKRFYRVPSLSDPERRQLIGGIERKAMNHPIQGCLTGDTIIKGLGYIKDFVGKEVEVSSFGIKNKGIVVYSGRKGVWELTLSNGTVLKITKNHKIPVINSLGRIYNKAVYKITKDDLLFSVVQPSDPYYEINPLNKKVEAYVKKHWGNKPRTQTIYEFCSKVNLRKYSVEDTYDIICEEDPHYFIANGIVVHNSNADTIKYAMIKCFNALKPYGDRAKLILTVHDEIIVECDEGIKEEIAPIVSNSLISGFGECFSAIPMESESLISPCWMKGKCEAKLDDGKKCGSVEFEFKPDSHYKTKLFCKKCGTPQ